MNSWDHAETAAKRWGGTPDDYIAIETFIDSSKQVLGDVRHRALYHHTMGVFLCAQIFGQTITVKRSELHPAVNVPVRLIAEQHIIEDLGWLPTPANYLEGMPVKAWMSGAQLKDVPLKQLLDELEAKHGMGQQAA